MSHGRTRSRAAIALEEAPASHCPHCGRTTKTVQGVCADCWGVKDPGRATMDFRPPPRTEPLLDFWSDLDNMLGFDPRFVIAIVVGIVLFLGAVVGIR